jgi:ABC-2 type transport system ATP-binding protein
MELMIKTHDLAKTYEAADGQEVQAVKGINLEVRRGEIFSLLGPNGAGKTTTISMISGLVDPTRGDAEIGGFSITHQPIEAKKLMGVVPQEIALYNTLTGRQNLEFFGKMYGLRGELLSERVDEVLEFVGLTDRQKDKVENYSGGMKRRLNVGVGLLHKPELVYMDEPTVGIDPQSRRRILDTVMELRDKRGMTVLYTTHLMEEAQELSDRVGIMDHGEIIAEGTQGELIQSVGEEDTLILKVGGDEIDERLPDRLQRDVPGLTQVLVEPGEKKGDSQIKISAKRGRKALPDVIQLTEAAGVEVQSVEIREPDLEAVFLQLTGRALRD